MGKHDRRLFRQDVEEHTHELRTNPYLADLRTALKERGFPAEEVLLAGYLENEGVAVGAIVTADQKVFEFEHDETQGATLARFEQIDDPESIATYITAIGVAIEMMGETNH